MLLKTCYYVTRLVLSLQTPINTLWSECAGCYSVQHGKVFKNFPWTFYVPENVAEVFLCVLKGKSCWPCLKCVLLQCWMIIVWGGEKKYWLEHLSSSSLLADLAAILISPRYQLAGTWAQCQSAFDRFTLSSTRVLNSWQPRNHLESYISSADTWPRW